MSVGVDLPLGDPGGDPRDRRPLRVVEVDAQRRLREGAVEPALSLAQQAVAVNDKADLIAEECCSQYDSDQYCDIDIALCCSY